MKIISGGQTGADRGALDAAISLGIPHGGWCPRGRKAEDGVIPDRYSLIETACVHYQVRTEKNVAFADATIIFTRGPMTPGSLLASSVASTLNKPWAHFDIAGYTILELATVTGIVHEWLNLHKHDVLNIAGSRESRAPGIRSDVFEIMREVLR